VHRCKSCSEATHRRRLFLEKICCSGPLYIAPDRSRQKVLKLLGDQTAATPPSAIQKRSIIRRVEFTRPLEIPSSIAAAGAALAGLMIFSTLA
jgi:hypothetical protein